MTLICSWCLKIIEKGEQGDSVSHGICPECFKEIDATLDAMQEKKAA